MVFGIIPECRSASFRNEGSVFAGIPTNPWQVLMSDIIGACSCYRSPKNHPARLASSNA